jgi:ammonium transporter Rh
MYWPSFNAAAAAGEQRDRAVMNTYFSIASGCVITFFLSSYLNNGKIHAEDILNATLAGGVAIGASADLMSNLGLSLIVGAVAGIISTIGFNKLTPYLDSKQILHDTCGVTNLHLIPGIIGGITSAIVIWTLNPETFGVRLQDQFPGIEKHDWSLTRQGF